MKIIVSVRCRNEEKNIERFMKGYDFADFVVVSDGGSTDGSLELLAKYPKVKLYHFDQEETVNGETWNEDAPHMNFVLDKAKKENPDFLIFDDMDCCPTKALRENARNLIEETLTHTPQINAFRLYMWGDEEYFPLMNRNFHPDYTSLWGWSPKDVDIHADPSIRHGTLVGTIPHHRKLGVPFCLLHRSWRPQTIERKIERYNALGLPMQHPLSFAGSLEKLPDWAKE